VIRFSLKIRSLLAIRTDNAVISQRNAKAPHVRSLNSLATTRQEKNKANPLHMTDMLHQMNRN
jgi:hypothetical protein